MRKAQEGQRCHKKEQVGAIRDLRTATKASMPSGDDVNMWDVQRVVEKLTDPEFYGVLKALADPALQSALRRLAGPEAQSALSGTGSLKEAVRPLVSPELESALTKLHSPAVQEALRKASAMFTAQRET